jgi:hypothetical protein
MGADWTFNLAIWENADHSAECRGELRVVPTWKDPPPRFMELGVGRMKGDVAIEPNGDVAPRAISTLILEGTARRSAAKQKDEE